MKLTALALVVVLSVSGCNATGSSTPTATPTSTSNASPSASIDVLDDMQKQAAQTLEFAQTLLGMAQAYAENKIEEAGYEHRMVWKDGESFAVTEDYRPTRINLYIKEGIVDKVEVG